MKAYVYIDGIGKRVIWNYFVNYVLIVDEIILIGQRLIWCLEIIERKLDQENPWNLTGTGVWNL